MKTVQLLPGGDIDPATADCRLQGTANSPSSTAKIFPN